MKKIYRLLLIFAVLLPALTGCNGSGEVDAPALIEPKAANIDTATVYRGDLVNLDYREGYITPETIELSFSVTGKIEEITAYSGKWVEEGEVLIKLEQDSLVKQIEGIQEQIEYLLTEGAYADRLADLDIAVLQTELKQMEEAGLEGNVIRMKQLEIENAALNKQQQAELRNVQLGQLNEALSEAQVMLSEQVITAPCAGNVYYPSSVKSGNYVQAESTVCYLMNPANISFVIEGYLSENNFRNKNFYAYVDGKEIRISHNAIDQLELRRAQLSGETLTTTFTIAEEDLSGLSAGMYGVLVLETIRHNNVLLIPVDAIYTESGRSYVYVIKDNVRERREIKIGGTNGVDTEVQYGLEEGEEVYVKN